MLAPGEDACRLALAKCASHERAASIGGLFAKGALYVGLVCAAIGAPFGAAAARILKGNAPETDVAACGAALAYLAVDPGLEGVTGTTSFICLSHATRDESSTARASRDICRMPSDADLMACARDADGPLIV